MYKQFRNTAGEIVQDYVCRISDNAFIPFAEDSIDYQQYLTWIAEGNTPEPAEEQQ